MTTLQAPAPTLPALADATQILATLPQADFAIAYGSHARGRASQRSDLDVLYVLTHTPAPGDVNRLVKQVKRLHAANGLGIDEEVAYAVKVWTTPSEVHRALALHGFNDGGALAIRPVPDDPSYLNSGRFKARLILNALTTPHVFLGGDAVHHRRTVARAESALRRLAGVLAPGALAHEMAAALITDPVSGATSKDWLGYEACDAAYLYSLLTAGPLVPGPRVSRAALSAP